MDFIKYAIRKPISVAVMVIFIILFGVIGLYRLPVQLTPDVALPQITVRTIWPGATPYEIEQEIIEEQEEVLKGVQNLAVLESTSHNGLGEITLTFKVGIDLDTALLRVSNKLNEVSEYPENAEKPIIDAAGAQSQPVIWMLLRTKDGDAAEILKYRTFFEDEIRQQIERVAGVGSLYVVGGTETRLDVVVDPVKMARHNVTINEVIGKIRGANRNASAGVLGIGKKDYRIRTTSKFQNIRDPLDVVAYDDGIKRVFLKDVARTTHGYEKNETSVMEKAKEVIVLGVRKEQGANVIALVEQMKKTVEALNNGTLAENGLYFHWVYDQTPYIHRAIDLVQKNVVIGGALAIMVLVLFLRSLTSTVTTALSIPISVIGTFIFLWVLDRNLNVVSLAGISFAVGMLVDNAIVVLENIDRHRRMGKKAFEASYDGAREVLGAVLASTATTVAVFVPVIFIEQQAGQLFRDISIAITFSILISLFVSVAVIPSMTHQFYKRRKRKNGGSDPVGRWGQLLVDALMRISGFFLKNSWTRLTSVVGFTAFSIFLVVLLLPKAEYLPQGNRNFVLGILVPPPGSSFDKRKEIGEYIYEEAKPYVEADYKDGFPQIKNIFYVGSSGLNLFGAQSVHDTEARKLLPLFNRIIYSIPDMFGISFQSGIFQQDITGGRAVDVDITGEKLADIIAAARILYGAIGQKIPGSQILPSPSLEISYPEANIIPNKAKLAANGLTEAELGVYVDVLMDGRKVDDYQPDGRRQVDLVVKGDDAVFTTPEDILGCMIVNNDGELIRVGDVAHVAYAQGMTQVNHLERRRTIQLQVTPPADMPLEAAIDAIDKSLIPALKAGGKLPNVKVAIGGTADKLLETRMALQWNFLLAVTITYLLMSALFENFFYPFIIMFSVPLAAAGGLVGLWLINTYVAPQGFDVLTMLGFIILVGTVVNNAILIVHQSLNNVRYEGYDGVEAITEAVRTRIRPIFMSAATSVFGLLPLVLSTGSGSELYRGLGSVLLGGLAFSTLFTLFVIPSLLAFFIRFERTRTTRAGEAAAYA